MLILAFDTSGMHGSVAVLDGASVLAEKTLSTDRRSAQTLAPAIVEILTSQRIEPRQIKLVATTVGPGSFTGLRVGVTAAKTFAYAAGAEVVGVSTLEVIASQAPSDQHQEIHAVLDAQRKELFVGRFRMVRQAALLDGTDERRTAFASEFAPAVAELCRVEAERAIEPIEDWLKSLRPDISVTGPGLSKIQDQVPQFVTVVPQNHWEPRASTVGQLAWREYQRGRRDDLWKLAPIYLRPSYAEEKAAKKTPPTSA